MTEPEWSWELYYGQYFVRRVGVLLPIVVPDQETAACVVAALNGDAARYQAALENIEAGSLEPFTVDLADKALRPEVGR